MPMTMVIMVTAITGPAACIMMRASEIAGRVDHDRRRECGHAGRARVHVSLGAAGDVYARGSPGGGLVGLSPGLDVAAAAECSHGAGGGFDLRVRRLVDGVGGGGELA